MSIFQRRSNNLSFGIVGLPNVGKSTLFNLLTKSTIPAANYPFCTTTPNEGIMTISDDRIPKLSLLYRPKKQIFPVLNILDIAGLIEGASEGKGLGNQFLDNIRRVDGIFHVVRTFIDEEVIHVNNTINPVYDIIVIENELINKDIEILKRIESKNRNKGELKIVRIILEILEEVKSGKCDSDKSECDGDKKVSECDKNDGDKSESDKNESENKNDNGNENKSEGKNIENNNPVENTTTNTNNTNQTTNINNQTTNNQTTNINNQINITNNIIGRKNEEILKKLTAHNFTSPEIQFITDLNLLSIKPIIILANMTESDYINKKGNKHLKSLLTHKIPFTPICTKIENPTMIEKISKIGFSRLNLIKFFTAGEVEVRGWIVTKDQTIDNAGKVIHTDFYKNFIRAEVIKYKEIFTEENPVERLSDIKAKGLVKTKGRDYIVEDGDIILYKLNKK
ncbi:putative GTP binding protein [Spraguea lophii 42_110]|uniref:Putative GTP binding protein n=1 Tax=Spraguea lophii (strain 42_110) TaxID=1358809 RepID=S7W5T3_SPRLO|nr:putative GTP binding protein [Spraguea lophii 42_110]